MAEIEIVPFEQLDKITEVDEFIRPEVESQIREDESVSYSNPIKYRLNKDVERYKVGSVGLHIQFRDIEDPIVLEFDGGLRQTFFLADLELAPADAPLSFYKEYSVKGKRGMRPETVEKAAKIQKLLDDGYTRKEVREITGISSSLFSQYVRYGQIRYNPSDEEKEQIKRDWSERSKRQHTKKRDAKIERLHEGMEKFDTIRQVCMYADTHPPTFNRWAAAGYFDDDKYQDFLKRAKVARVNTRAEMSRQMQKGNRMRESLLQKDPTLITKIYALADQGYSRKEICSELNIGYSTIQKWLDTGKLDSDRLPSQRGKKSFSNNGSQPVEEVITEVAEDTTEEAEEHIVNRVEDSQNDRMDRLIAIMEEVSKNQTKLLECVSSLLQQSNKG